MVQAQLTTVKTAGYSQESASMPKPSTSSSDLSNLPSEEENSVSMAKQTGNKRKPLPLTIAAKKQKVDQEKGIYCHQ